LGSSGINESHGLGIHQLGESGSIQLVEKGMHCSKLAAPLAKRFHKLAEVQVEELVKELVEGPVKSKGCNLVSIQ
jgi:hypothetical protein